MSPVLSLPPLLQGRWQPAGRSDLSERSNGLPSRARALPPHLLALRDRLRAEVTGAAGSVALAGPPLDAHLPGGALPLGQLHEVGAEGVEAEIGAAMAGFAALLAGTIQPARPVLWIAPRADLNPPGLSAFGLDPARLVLVRPRDDAGTLGAMEAALREGGLAAVVGEVGRLERTASRRLHLAAQRHGVTALVLRRWPHGRARADREATAAVTRWRIASAPSAAEGGPQSRLLGPPRWAAALLHARGGRPGAWLLEPAASPDREEDDDDRAPARPAHPFRVVAELAGDAAAAPVRRAAV
jgi:protein ImuA